MSKVIGVIPARMGSSRFPGKPLYPILGVPMLEHVYKRASLFEGWHKLIVATCDKEIYDFANAKGMPVMMTSDRHERALDRVAECVANLGEVVEEDAIVINVQGDEPMMHPAMIEAVIQPFSTDVSVNGTLLGMPIMTTEVFHDPNILKIVHNLKNDILYTSRSPIPYCKQFDPNVGVHRVYGIFAFRWAYLKRFTQLSASPLEINESCDSNRLYDYGLTQRMVGYPYMHSFSVDAPEDIATVEKYMREDDLFNHVLGNIQ